MTDITLDGAEINLTVVEGSTNILECTVKDAAGDAVDITGATFTFKAAPGRTSAAATISKSNGDGITIQTPASGRVDIQIDPADTEDEIRTFVHDIMMTDASSNVSRVGYGTLTVRPRSV